MSLTHEIPQVVNWLRSKVEEAHATGLVVGISGGIDSAVCAALAKRAFPESSLGIILPIHSEREDTEDGTLVAETVGITHYTIDLGDEHLSMLKKSFDKLGEVSPQTRQLTDANLRARLRMTAIYTAANALNYLVIGTDNAAEVYTGYFTKFGDGACDIMPLAEFSKGEVRQLALELNVPQKIVDKKPSAGLWHGQTDENEMGTTYDYIDAHLAGKPIPDNHRAIIEQLHARSHHKRTVPAQFKRNR